MTEWLELTEIAKVGSKSKGWKMALMKNDEKDIGDLVFVTFQLLVCPLQVPHYLLYLWLGCLVKMGWLQGIDKTENITAK